VLYVEAVENLGLQSGTPWAIEEGIVAVTAYLIMVDWVGSWSCEEESLAVACHHGSVSDPLLLAAFLGGPEGSCWRFHAAAVLHPLPAAAAAAAALLEGIAYVSAAVAAAALAEPTSFPPFLAPAAVVCSAAEPSGAGVGLVAAGSGDQVCRQACP